MDNTLTRRNDFLQAARGIAVIAVVLIHCKNGIDFKNTDFPQNFNYYFWLFERQFLNFAVGLFFFLSAYFVKREEVRQEPLKWIRKRVIRIGIPYLVFSLIFITVKFFQRIDSIQISFFIKQVLAVLTGNAWFHLYFIFVLFQFIFLTPLILKFKVLKTVFLVLNIILLCTRYFIEIPFIDNFSKSSFLYWFIFYAFGLSYDSATKWIKQHPIFLCGIAILLNIIEVQILLYNNYSDAFVAGQLKLSSVFYAFSIINLIMFFNEKNQIDYIPNRIEQFAVDVGNSSFGIYLIHPLFLILCNHIIINNYTLEQGGAITQMAELLISFSLSYGSCFLLKRVLGNKISKKFFGF